MGIVAMRRTKTQKINGKPLVELPDRQLFIQPVELSLEERKLYDSMATEGKLVVGKYVWGGCHCISVIC
jgi:SWI/SNF-related matrix-associated actin-dependent regulator of chromatin subfamily A3